MIKILYPFQISILIDNLLKEKKFFLENKLKKEVYLTIMNIISKLNFKKVNWDLKTNLFNILDLILQNQDLYAENLFKYYFLLIFKQIILYYDVKTCPAIMEKMATVINFIIDNVSNFERDFFNSNLTSVDNIIAIFCYENLLIMIYFSEYHEKFKRIIPISLNLCNNILKSLMLFFDNSSSNENSNSMTQFSENEIRNFLKLVCMFLNHSSYYIVFHNELCSKEGLSTFFQLMACTIKHIQLIIFNSLINVIEANGNKLVKRFLEISLEKVDELNKYLIIKENEKKVNIDPFLSILEHMYFSKDLLDYSENEVVSHQLEISQIKTIIGYLLTNTVIMKFNFKFSKKILEIMITESYSNLEIESRLLVILLKILPYAEGLIIDLREKLLDFFKNSIKNKNKNDLGVRLISLPTMRKFINNDVRNMEGAISLDNLFFWEYSSNHFLYFIVFEIINRLIFI